ncbi:hypothetical protein E2C01_092749 [Portunus trituberculatus]|uniref:Uncharacterized protein n=1 Tax=Portunus trituberculatus TaxID=210409 RepID=A0A5B7JYJ1_PORTR|nr:hypothetical protein [Portunus trituberculatus]
MEFHHVLFKQLFVGQIASPTPFHVFSSHPFKERPPNLGSTNPNHSSEKLVENRNNQQGLCSSVSFSGSRGSEAAMAIILAVELQGIK